MKLPIFIIEHLEPELLEWCLIEYKNISKISGKNNLWFTNLRISEAKELEKYGKVFVKSVKSMHLSNVAVLDPEAISCLNPETSKKFDYFVFGGILGDDPPKKRTTFELTKFLKNAKAYNLGDKQMSTDNAVYVVKKIISGKKFSDMNFQESIEIKINDIESTILPYRYAVFNGRPIISRDLINYLKKKNR